MSRDEMTFELCSQLHKQYAEADNQKANIIIYFIVSITFIFSGYGFFLEKYYISLSDRALPFYAITLLASILLFTLSVVIINYGYTQRRDQFIINIIRRIYFVGKSKTMFDDLFLAKDKCILTFLPNNYFIIYVSCLVIQTIFSFLSYKLLLFAKFQTNDFTLLLFLCYPLLSIICLFSYYIKYKSCEKKYYDIFKEKHDAKKISCNKYNILCFIQIFLIIILLLFAILSIINYYKS